MKTVKTTLLRLVVVTMMTAMGASALAQGGAGGSGGGGGTSGGGSATGAHGDFGRSDTGGGADRSTFRQGNAPSGATARGNEADNPAVGGRGSATSSDWNHGGGGRTLPYGATGHDNQGAAPQDPDYGSLRNGGATGTTAGNQADAWRYRWHQGHWWYYTPQSRWMIYGGNGWVDFKPGMTEDSLEHSAAYPSSDSYGYTTSSQPASPQPAVGVVGDCGYTSYYAPSYLGTYSRPVYYGGYYWPSTSYYGSYYWPGTSYYGSYYWPGTSYYAGYYRPWAYRSYYRPSYYYGSYYWPYRSYYGGWGHGWRGWGWGGGWRHGWRW